MKMQHLRLFILAVLVVLFSSIALLLVTGAVRSVDISGNSMEPLLTSDDFVVVKRSDSYQKGDVVLYYNSQLQHYLLHRIVKVENERYTFKGDNNNSNDSYIATQEDLRGELYWSLDGGAFWLSSKNLFIFGLFLLSALLFPWQVIFGRDENNEIDTNENAELDEVQDEEKMTTNKSDAMAKPIKSTYAHAYTVCALFAGLGVISLMFLFVIGREDVKAAEVYKHTGDFSYNPLLNKEAQLVYGKARLETGDPIYLNAISDIDVKFNYQLEALAKKVDVHNTKLNLETVLIADDGWSYTLDKQEFTSSNNLISGVAKIDSKEIRDVLLRLNTTAKANFSTYKLRVIPSVQINGQALGADFKESYQPILEFTTDGNRIFQDSAQNLQNPSTGEGADMFNPEEVIVKDIAVTNKILGIPVVTLQPIALIATVFFLLLLGLFQWMIRVKHEGNEK